MFRGEKQKSQIKDFRGTIDEFVLGEFGGIRSIIKYYNIWLESWSDNNNRLTIRYEDMVKKYSRTIT